MMSDGERDERNANSASPAEHFVELDERQLEQLGQAGDEESSRKLLVHGNLGWRIGRCVSPPLPRASAVLLINRCPDQARRSVK